ncbi:MAG: META domain-containing protein [Anaerolineae bacterium]
MASVLITAGCSQAEETQGPLTESDLIGSKWQLTQMVFYNLGAEVDREENIILDSDLLVTLNFRDSSVGGSSGCNNYKAVWEFGEFGQLTTRSPVIQSDKVCAAEVMHIENKFLQLISDFRFAELNAGVLEVKASQGNLFFIKSK